MRDSERLQVENHNSATMVLKTLASVNGGAELTSLPLENIDDEEMAEENFDLHLSEDEDDEIDKTAKQNGESDEMIENEVLNKFDTAEDVYMESTDAKTEDELLNDDQHAKSTAVVVINEGEENEPIKNVQEEANQDKSSVEEKDTTEKVDKEIQPVEEEKTIQSQEKEKVMQAEEKVKQETEEETKVTEEKEKVTEKEKMVIEEEFDIMKAEIKQEEIDLDDVELNEEDVDKVKEEIKEESDAEVNSETNENDKSAVADDSSVNSDVVGKEIKKEGEGEETEQTNAEILKNQIMNTEHLLQIVENDTEENDKESNDKVESEDNEAETDKNEEEYEQEQDDDSQGDKKTSDDGVHIEESSLSKDATDVDMDREYQSIVDDAITKENQEKKSESEVVETAPTEAPAVDESMDVDANENKENNEEAVNTEVTPEKDEETIEPPKNDDTDSTKTITSGKRTLSEENVQQDAKKMKLGTEVDDVAKEQPAAKEPPADIEDGEKITEARKHRVLGTVGAYLKKNCLTKLCYEDLEEICVQKVCEGICYKSELGELRHQLGVQEQMAEMWRKEVAQLSKQARDLEMVNKRLLHEVRLKNVREKPLVPVKITRSVGLQVRSDMLPNVMASKQRRLNRSPQTATPAFNQKQQVRSPLLNNTNNRINKLPVPNRPQQNMARVSPVQNTKIKVANQKNWLLSQALQNATNAANATGPSTTPAVSNQTVAAPTAVSVPVSTTTVTPPKTTLPVNRVAVKKPAMTTKAVFDLTDEDTATTTPTRNTPAVTKNAMVSKTVAAPAGVRILTSAIKPGALASGQVVPTTNTSRFMYLYNNNQLLTADGKPTNQKVMFKIGSGNGVLASVANGSAIAVNTSTRTAQQVSQLKLTSGQGTTSMTTTNAITRAPTSKVHISKHPAPLPAPPITQNSQPARKPIPPKPHLYIKRSGGGIVLSWCMPYNLDNFESIVSYQLYVYQETTSPPSSDMWRKVGDAKALALPMACTLTQFAVGNKYHFAVRAVDVHKRMGPFSAPEQILL